MDSLDYRNDDLDADPIEIIARVERLVNIVNERLSRLPQEELHPDNIEALSNFAGQMCEATAILRNIPDSRLGGSGNLLADKKRNLVIASELAYRLYEQSQQWIAYITQKSIEESSGMEQQIQRDDSESTQLLADDDQVRTADIMEEEPVKEAPKKEKEHPDDDRWWFSRMWSSKEQLPMTREEQAEKVKEIQRDVAQLKEMFNQANVASVEQKEQIDAIQSRVEETCHNNQLIEMKMKESRGWIDVLRANKYLVTAVGFTSTVMVVTPFIHDLLAKKGSKTQKSDN